MSYPGVLEGDSPEAQREQAVKRILVPLADAAFAARPDIQSVILAVAQYWNDEADDAVHANIHYSKRHTPIWPHECSYFSEEEQEHVERADFCRWCGGRVPGHPSNPEWVPWDDNGSAIPAFESYCREACHQEMSQVEAYLPYAVVRRKGGVEIVGKPVRAWADRIEAIDRPPPSGQLAELLAAVYAAPDEDGPRSVLADFLLEKSDPIGELIALQLQDSRSPAIAELIARHGAAWMGPIHRVVAKSSVVFSRGFLAEAEVLFDAEDQIEQLGSDRGWSTVQRIHFLDGGLQHLDRAMRALRTVSGLFDEALIAAAGAQHAWPIRDLSAHLEERSTFGALEAATSFAALRRLELAGETLRTNDAVQLLRSPMGAKLERLAVTNVAASAIPAWLDALERFTTLSAFEVTQRLDAGRRAGWTLAFERGQDGRLSTLRARLDNLAGDGRIERISELVEALPRDALVHLLLERTPLFEPLVEDELALREVCKSQRRFAGVALS